MSNVDKQVVFATDLEGSVEHGLALATRHAHERGATLIILHVLPLRVADGIGMLHSAADMMQGDTRRRLRALVPDDSRVPVKHVIAVGDPADQIREYIAREPVDLLVMEARTRRFFHRLWGPDLPTILRNTMQCAMLTYRGDFERRDVPTEAPQVVEAVPFEALTAMLDARVDALSRWMSSQREAVVSIASRPSIRDGIAATLQTPDAQRTELLTLELDEHCRASGASGFEVWVDGERRLHRGSSAAADPRRDACLQRARQGAMISLPLEPEEGTTPVIMAASAVDIGGDQPAVLVLTHDAREHFLRILAQLGPSPTAETYAFDADGVMVSNTLFPEQLRRLGLLPAELQAPGRIRVCDPGGNLLTGEVEVPSVMPLTRMALSATAGESGSDWNGYRDYRGVEVVGTWRWVDEHGFGVAAEMDRPLGA